MTHQPSEKAPEIEALLTTITGKDRKLTIEKGGCVTCNMPAKGFAVGRNGRYQGGLNFRDELSLKEYTISGMCQECQDSTFRGGADE